MILIVAAALFLLAVVVRIGVPMIRRQRLNRQLRGDWWSGFEREFRAYANRLAQAARDAEWHA